MQSALAPTTPNKKAGPVLVDCKSYTAAYESITVKLSKRFYVTFYLFSLVFAILFQTGFSFNFYTCFTLKTLLFSLLIFSVGIPISMWRHVEFTVWEPTYCSNLAEFLSTYTSPDNFVLSITYIISSLIIISTYFSWIMNEKYTSTFLLEPGLKLGASQLNQEKIFVYFYSIFLGFNYTVDFIVNRSMITKINSVQQSFFNEFKNSFANTLFKSAKRAIYSFRNAYISFIIFNGSIYYYVARLFALNYRVLDTPVVGFRWIDTHFFLRLIVAGVLATCIFNVCNLIYDVIYSRTLPYTDSYKNQFNCLIQGLSEKENDHIKVAAFSELALLSSKRPEKRKELFETVGNELHDSAWYKIMTECLLVIGDLHTKIDIEYNGVRPVAAPAPVVKPVEKIISNRLAFSNGSIFATTKKNQIDYDDRTGLIFSEASELAEHVTSNLPKSEAVISNSYKYLQKSTIVEMIKSLEFKFGHVGLFESFYSQTVLRRMQEVFNKYQLTIWAVQSLGGLVSGSLTEDKYGFVQNDIARILNTLLGLLVELENYKQSPPLAYRKLYDQHLISGEVEAVISALKEAIYQISITFKNYNSAFDIDRKYASKWQKFLNFQE